MTEALCYGVLTAAEILAVTDEATRSGGGESPTETVVKMRCPICPEVVININTGGVQMQCQAPKASKFLGGEFQR